MDNSLSPAHRNLHLVGLGSNATEYAYSNAALLKQAVGRIKAEGLVVERISRIFLTPAYPAGSGPGFANACLSLQSERTPFEVLTILHRIETAMGRVRTERWGQRVIDLDLLASGDRVLPDAATVRHWMELRPEDQRRMWPSELILPHPRLHQRAFVLVPLAEIAPDWVHPLTGERVDGMLAGLDAGEIASIRPI